MKSRLFSINLKDLLRGAFLALATSIGTALIKIIEAGDLLTLLEFVTWKPILISGISVFLIYLLKNFLTNSEDKVLKSERPKKITGV